VVLGEGRREGGVDRGVETRVGSGDEGGGRKEERRRAKARGVRVGVGRAVDTCHPFGEAGSAPAAPPPAGRASGWWSGC
jgi:hypothetical protein